MKRYRLGNTVFSQQLDDRFVWERKHLDLSVTLYESELLEMGAQLVEEEKPQEIELLGDPEGYVDFSKAVMRVVNYLIEEQVDLKRAFNTHLSECGKEKHAE